MDTELVIYKRTVKKVLCYFLAFCHTDVIFYSTFDFMCAGLGYPYAGKPQQPGECFFPQVKAIQPYRA